MACADHTCRESYLQCLQAVHELEISKQQQRERAQLEQLQSVSAVVSSRHASRSASGELIWVYSQQGVIPHQTNLKASDIRDVKAVVAEEAAAAAAAAVAVNKNKKYDW